MNYSDVGSMVYIVEGYGDVGVVPTTGKFIIVRLKVGTVKL